jgi:hypothetical protein
VYWPVQPPPRPTSSRPKFVAAGDLTANPIPIQWRIRELFEDNTLSMLFGDPGSGKSFMALDMAYCIATGQPFHGHAVRPGPVIYLAGEGQRGLGRRLQALEIERGVSLQGMPLYLRTVPVGLCDVEQAAALHTDVRALIEDEGLAGDPALICVDTVARNFGPGDENATKDMAGFVQSLDIWLREPFGSAVLVVHHSGHGDKTRGRGSSVLKAALDTEYQVDRDPGDKLVRLTCTKAKDHDPVGGMAFQLKGVQLPYVDDQGNPVWSAVLERVGFQPPPKAGAQSRGKNQQAIIATLQRLYDERRQTLISGGHDPDGARVAKTDLRDAAGFGSDKNAKTRFYQTLQRLEQNGEVVTSGLYVYLP